MNIQQFADKFDKRMNIIDDKINNVHGNIKSIQQCLGGNEELGQEGFIKDHIRLKREFEKTQKEVNRLSWFTGLISTGWALLLGYLGLK